MALRIHFSSIDPQRLRLATSVDPLWELVLSVAALQRRDQAQRPLWREYALGQLKTRQGEHTWAPLRTLVPPHGAFPDFLTPTGADGDVDAACELVSSTPTRQVAQDLDAAFMNRRPTTWARALATDRAERYTLVRHIRQYYQTVLDPIWPQVCECVRFDRARRARQLAQHGVEELLRNLPAPIQWDGTALHTRYPTDRTVELDGRGLILVPSYFCYDTPVTFIDPERTPVLVYPAHAPRYDPSTPGFSPRSSSGARLGGVLGATRATVLAALITPATTSTLAQRAGISLASASEHAAVLREADIITTDRCGRSVVHALTPVGRALVEGSTPRP